MQKLHKMVIIFWKHNISIQRILIRSCSLINKTDALQVSLSYTQKHANDLQYKQHQLLF